MAMVDVVIVHSFSVRLSISIVKGFDTTLGEGADTNYGLRSPAVNRCCLANSQLFTYVYTSDVGKTKICNPQGQGLDLRGQGQTSRS